MIDEQTLKSFRCLITGSSLHPVEATQIARINQAIERRQIRCADGREFEKILEGGLTNQERSVVYPVYNNIPNMVAGNAIELAQLDEITEIGEEGVSK